MMFVVKYVYGNVLDLIHYSETDEHFDIKILNFQALLQNIKLIEKFVPVSAVILNNIRDNLR